MFIRIKSSAETRSQGRDGLTRSNAARSVSLLLAAALVTGCVSLSGISWSECSELGTSQAHAATKVAKKSTSKAKTTAKKTTKKPTKKTKKAAKKKVYLSTVDRLKAKVASMQKQLKKLKSTVKSLKKRTKKLHERKAALASLQSDPINLLMAYVKGENPSAELLAIDTELKDINKTLSKTGKRIKTMNKSIKSVNKTIKMFSPRRHHLTRGGGRFSYNGHTETYYSQKMLPGGGLRIPGRHVRYDGVICDKDGYVCVASPNSYDRSVRKVIDTSLGLGKAYDYCPGGSVDIYTNW